MLENTQAVKTENKDAERVEILGSDESYDYPTVFAIDPKNGSVAVMRILCSRRSGNPVLLPAH